MIPLAEVRFPGWQVIMMFWHGGTLIPDFFDDVCQELHIRSIWDTVGRYFGVPLRFISVDDLERSSASHSIDLVVMHEFRQW